MAATTRSLTIRAEPKCSGLDFHLINGLKHAFQKMAPNACLSNVRYFSLEAEPDYLSHKAWHAMEGFQAWVLESAQRLEALRLPQWREDNIGRLHTTYIVKLQHLKHLEMDARMFVRVFTQAATQLPNLETLHLHGSIEHAIEHSNRINVLGCRQLRHMVQDCLDVLPVQHELKCHLGIRLGYADSLNLGFKNSTCGTQSLAAVRQTLKATKSLVLCAAEYTRGLGTSINTCVSTSQASRLLL